MKWGFIIISVLFLQQTLHAQYPQVTIPGSQVRKIQSKIVNQEYELHILLPGGYEKSNKKYPVVYLMDAQWDFPLVKSIYGQHYYDGFIPEMIIVGVLWGGTSPDPDSLRGRDYTPTKVQWMKQSGGADKFLFFMKEELFPFIETNFKADTGNRSLMGCSLGGLLTLYALFTHTEMFTGYAAASPAIGWDNTVLNEYEKAFAQKKIEKPVRVYMTVGDVERGAPLFNQFGEKMINAHYANVSIYANTLENTGHSGTKSETYARGLQYIFERPRLKLNDAALNKYTGAYSFANGVRINIKNENDHLAYYLNPNFKYDLFAANETEFYSTAEFFKMKFKKENNVITGFELQRYGNTESAKKLD